jgi:hypothetical protein
MGSSRGIFFYVFLPMVVVGCLGAYFFHRHISLIHPSQIAADVLAELPDPDQTSDIGVQQ